MIINKIIYSIKKCCFFWCKKGKNEWEKGFLIKLKRSTCLLPQKKSWKIHVIKFQSALESFQLLWKTRDQKQFFTIIFGKLSGRLENFQFFWKNVTSVNLLWKSVGLHWKLLYYYSVLQKVLTPIQKVLSFFFSRQKVLSKKVTGCYTNQKALAKVITWLKKSYDLQRYLSLYQKALSSVTFFFKINNFSSTLNILYPCCLSQSKHISIVSDWSLY